MDGFFLNKRVKVVLVQRVTLYWVYGQLYLYSFVQYSYTTTCNTCSEKQTLVFQCRSLFKISIFSIKQSIFQLPYNTWVESNTSVYLLSFIQDNLHYFNQREPITIRMVCIVNVDGSKGIYNSTSILYLNASFQMKYTDKEKI